MNIPLKTRVKYWFEYLRLAHQSHDPKIIQSLNANKSFYKEWGNYLNTSFDDWWKSHAHLFRELSKVKRLQSNDEIEENSFSFQVPFTYAPTTASKIFKEMYEREFEARRTVKKKLKKVYGGTFSLTVDDLKVDRMRYYLHYTKNVYLPLKNSDGRVTTKQFIKKAEEVFSKVKKLTKSSDKSRIPFQTSSKVYENQNRNARRYNIYSDNLLFNVAKGIFPGEYEKPRDKVITIKKSPNYPVRKYKKDGSSVNRERELTRDHNIHGRRKPRVQKV